MISFIIPAYNEEKYIEKTLLSIPNKFEKIVVCNGCTDQTYNIAKKYAKVINMSEKNVSRARNLGAKSAGNEILVFLDADTRLSNKAINFITKIKNNIFGTFKTVPNKSNIKHKLYFMFKNLGPIFKLYNASGAIFCHKNIFKKINGFNENITKGEDLDFIIRAKKYGKFYCSRNYAITSTRRFDKIGYLKICIFWLKERILKLNQEYPAIR